MERGLREQTYAVDVVPDGEQAVYPVSVNHYDVIVLDLMQARLPASWDAWLRTRGAK